MKSENSAEPNIAHEASLDTTTSGDERIKIEDDGHEEEHTEPFIPSFTGRLNLASFRFSTPQTTINSKNSSPVRRSQRQSSTPPVRAPPLKRQSDNTLQVLPPPKKKSRSPSGYAPPSQYAHLCNLPDRIDYDLIVLFIGLNPGIKTAALGHAYAHPSNLFWKLLHSSGCTTRRCRPEEDVDLPRLFSLGNTNIVERPTRNGSELSKQEMDDSVQALEDKIIKFRPECACIVGKSIWESVWRVRHGRGIKKEEFKYGWQDKSENMGKQKDWEGAKVFVATSTSGLAASLLPAQKEEIWRDLGVWVEQRRFERGWVKEGDKFNTKQEA